ncbi:hypothetical protein [Pseudomonas alabamensis]|uniref:hypothetical protein n=1 Tax=Pseudomonas alabamensis TaxID=3064349 RepID=UPI0021D865FD|nr:hypothetical protein [Pseudomonas entomophila]
MMYPDEGPEGACEAAIAAVCNRMGLARTSWIAECWKRHDGAFLCDQVLIYSTDEIEERNRTFEVATYFKGHVAVGDDSGGRLILVSTAAFDGFLVVDSGSATLDDADALIDLGGVLAYVTDCA